MLSIYTKIGFLIAIIGIVAMVFAILIDNISLYFLSMGVAALGVSFAMSTIKVSIEEEAKEIGEIRNGNKK